MSTPQEQTELGAPPFTTGAIARALGAELDGPGDIELRRLNTIEGAGPEDLTFVRSKAYAAKWPESKGGACLVSRDVALPRVERRAAAIIVDNADLALIRLIPRFKPPERRPSAGVHPTALIGSGARIDPSASIGPMCVIGDDVELGAGVVLRAGVVIGAGVRIGAQSELEPNVVVHDWCVIGRHCLLHSGCIIGADGFGFRPSPDGRGVVKIPHAGNVEIEDHVEIGACTCVDRGKFGPTVIGAGTKLDNHVQIAHNVVIGRSCLIAGCTGIAGSVVIGDGVMIGGHCGIADNLRIGRGARLAAFAAVMKDVAPGATVMGVPAVPHIQFFRQAAVLGKLTGGGRRKA
ncbi:MAG: UDP-3-O-(3-hydroxymyristoyl)glucosamine N-acyltransferase [Phycisphaerales bacterium]